LKEHLVCKFIRFGIMNEYL
jgi:hypothetical protein